MKSPSPARLLFSWLAFTAFAGWLTLFLHDPKRPSTVQERADFLAAENLSELSLSASTPPSPAHWEQRGILTVRETGIRVPLARDGAALAIAASGLNARLAGVIAFGLAGLSICWLLAHFSPSTDWANDALAAALLLTVAHGRAWQMSDPFPYLLLAACAVTLGQWLRFRETSRQADGLKLGVSLAAVLICEPALFFVQAAIVTVDLGMELGRARRIEPRALVCVALPAVLVFGLFAARNTAITGSPWTSANERYTAANVTAPAWIWEKVRQPRDGVDPVLERYDELVALPASRWPIPAYRTLLHRMQAGAHYAGGLALALAGLAYAIARPSASPRPALLVLAGAAFVALSYYQLSVGWWTAATPAIAVLAACFLQCLDEPRTRKRAVWGLAAAHLTFFCFGQPSKPAQAEYDYAKYLEQIELRLAKEPGSHLVFVSNDETSDAQVESSRLSRDWRRQRIVYARDLSPSENAALAAAMPDRNHWRIIVSKTQIGLLRWSPSTEPPKEAKQPGSS